MTNTEIQVGEYVRTNNARGIRKVARINEEATVNRYLFIDGYDHSDTIYGIIRADQITKHSFNIIDLIEAGDYIKMGKNNYYLGIDNIYEFAGELNIRTSNDFLWEDVKNDKDFTVYSIITHEQMKSMEYKVNT